MIHLFWPTSFSLVHLSPIDPGFGLAHQARLQCSPTHKQQHHSLPVLLCFVLNVLLCRHASACSYCIYSIVQQQAHTTIVPWKEFMIALTSLLHCAVSILSIGSVFLSPRTVPSWCGWVLPVLWEERCQSVFPRFSPKATTGARFQLLGRWENRGYQQVCVINVFFKTHLGIKLHYGNAYNSWCQPRKHVY